MWIVEEIIENASKKEEKALEDAVKHSLTALAALALAALLNKLP